jgi:hypothetical protein
MKDKNKPPAMPTEEKSMVVQQPADAAAWRPATFAEKLAHVPQDVNDDPYRHRVEGGGPIPDDFELSSAECKEVEARFKSVMEEIEPHLATYPEVMEELDYCCEKIESEVPKLYDEAELQKRDNDSDQYWTNIHKKRDQLDRYIEKRVVALAATRFINHNLVLHRVAAALEIGKVGYSTFLEEYEKQAQALLQNKELSEAAKRYFTSNQFPEMAQYVTEQYKIAEKLAYGAHSGDFYVGNTKLPAPLLDSWIRTVLTRAAIIEDKWQGRPVAVDIRLIAEVRSVLKSHRVIDDRPQAGVGSKSANTGAPILDLHAIQMHNGPPPFETVLVLDPTAWTNSDEIWRACEPCWRAWCNQSGGKYKAGDRRTMFKLLTSWGGSAINREQKRRAWGYTGLRLVQMP